MKYLILFLLLPFFISTASYTRQSCSANQILDTTTLACSNCPNTMRPNPLQPFPTSCICNKGYYPASDIACNYLGPNSTLPCADNQFFDVVSTTGTYQPATSSNTCSNCDAMAYSNNNGTGCQPCPRNMRYSATENICVCVTSLGAVTQTTRGCFTSAEQSLTSSLGSPSSKYYNTLKYLFPACSYFNDLLSCSQLVNLCTYSMGHGDATNEPECKFFTNLQSFRYFHELNSQVDQFYISPGKFSKNQQIKVKLLYYLPTGNFVKEKQMRLPDLLRCGMPSDNSVVIKLGNNIQVTCSFNFDYLVQQSQSQTYQSYVYEMFILGQNNNYFPVTVYIGSSTKPIKRFFLEDTYTNPTYMNILNDFKLTFALNSTGYLVSPTLKLAYKKLSIQGSKVTPTIDKDQSITYQIKFVYDLQTFWPAFIGIFIAINIIVLIQSLIRTYIAYLNKQSVLNFFYYLMNFWSIWIFYFLIAISGYWFFFCKTTQDVYIFIPDSGTDVFYVAFFIIAGVMGLFRVITVFIDKQFKLNYQVFLINWQKSDNSWRQIFIVNSLAEFYTHRTISFFWMLLTVLFFLVGLNWQSHAAEVAHTTLSSIYYFNPINRVFLYFLGATIFLVIGIAFKVLRRLSVIKWPYPFEDFADYCNVCNISLFFMKKRETEAYYMHSEITRHVEVSFNELNAVVRQRQNKGKGIINQYSFNPGQSMYIIYACKDLQEKFANMIKRTEQDHKDQLVSINKRNDRKSLNKVGNLRQRFIETQLKPYLEDSVKTQTKPPRTLVRRLFGLPQIDLRDQSIPRKKNTILKDEYLDIVSEVFPNGNQFQEIHTIIILFLMFLLITANASAAALISYFICQYIMDNWISRSCRSKLQKMTKVKQGFML